MGRRSWSMTEAEKTLLALFDKAKAAVKLGGSTRSYEPAFVALLRHIKQHRDCLACAEQLFLKEVRKGARIHEVYELVEFCMHELRLPVVYEEAQNQLSGQIPPNGGPPPTNVMLHIISAYEDDWDGLEDGIYEYYAG